MFDGQAWQCALSGGTSGVPHCGQIDSSGGNCPSAETHESSQNAGDAWSSLLWEYKHQVSSELQRGQGIRVASAVAATPNARVATIADAKTRFKSTS
jgi:hypothetical protein